MNMTTTMTIEKLTQNSRFRRFCVKATAPGLVVAVALFSTPALAAGDPVAGKEKAATCAACHGENGNSQIDTNPILAGQYASYIEHALKSYRDGSRQNAIMAGFATQLTDQDIADLAAWFSSQSGPLRTAPKN